MSQTLDQIFIANPSTTMLATDLVYLVHSPFTPGTDSAITWANMQAAITAVGTIAAGIWQGTLIGATYGGTGINNGSKTITLGGSLTTSGAFASTFTMTAATNVTFPTSGTLATTTGTVTTATNLAGGTANDIPYQTGVGVTSFVTETANGVLTYSSGGVPTSSTTLPATVQTNITGLGVIAQNLFLSPGAAAGPRYIVLNTDSTYTGSFNLQAGAGSAAFGGSLVMYGNSHATKPGWVTAGLSATTGAQFTVNSNGNGAGTDVFIITNSGVVTTGVWNGTTIAVANGGTGITSFGTGVATALGQNVNGSGAISLTTSPTFVTPVLGAATGTSLVTSGNIQSIGGGIVAGASGTAGLVISYPGTANSGALILQGVNSSGNFNGFINNASLSAARTWIFPDANGTVTLLGNSSTGSGSVVLANAPTFVTGTVTAPSVTFSSTSGIIGTTTNNNAAAGSVGEEMESIISSASAVSLTTTASLYVTTLTLTAGDWDVWGNVTFVPQVGVTNVLYSLSWISSAVTAALPDPSLRNCILNGLSGALTVTSYGALAPSQRFTVANGNTIVVGLGANSSFTLGTNAACGALYARRRR